MKKGWRVIMTVVLIAALLGAVCVGVGLMTGAELPRIYSALDDRYQLSSYLAAYTQYAGELMNAVTEVWQTPVA